MSEKSYLSASGDKVVITLARPATFDGAQRSTLTMREPLVRDLEQSQSAASSDAAREIQLFANLLEVSADDLRGLGLRDYKRLQEAYERFSD